jgi:Fic family protein
MPCIYEHTNWLHFKLDHNTIATQLAAVRHLQGRVLGRMEGLAFIVRSQASLESMTEEVLKSSEIEGEHLDRHQVRSSIARKLGVDIGALAPVDCNVEGVVEMAMDAIQHYNERLTKKRLFGWHAALFPTGYSGVEKITVGNWRMDDAGPMQVVSGPAGRERLHYQAPTADTVAREMTAFLKWFNASLTMILW